MDNNDNGQAPATDDQELAQVLAGMNQQAATDQPTDQPATDQPVADQAADDGGLQFEETGTPPVPVTDTPPPEPPAEQPVPDFPPTPDILPGSTPELVAESAIEPFSLPTQEAAHGAPTTTTSPELDAIKKDALDHLRPLVDKLDLPAQEKFDTLLLIIRSTDDQSLLTAANEAAKSIEDDTKRADALLDVIKEIDFFTHPQS